MTATEASTVVTEDGVIIMSEHGARHIQFDAHVPLMSDPLCSPMAGVWHAFAAHDGQPCSLHVGDWMTAFLYAVDYRKYQVPCEIHFVEERLS